MKRSTLLWSLCLLLPLALAAANCRAISGLDDYQVKGAGGSGGSTGLPDGEYTCDACGLACAAGLCINADGAGGLAPTNDQKCDGNCIVLEGKAVCESDCDGQNDPLGCDQIEQANLGEWTLCGPSDLNVPCVISCEGDGCQDEILCPWASTQPCTITCEGAGSCADKTVECGPGGCTLECLDGGCAGLKAFSCAEAAACPNCP